MNEQTLTAELKKHIDSLTLDEAQTMLDNLRAELVRSQGSHWIAGIYNDEYDYLVNYCRFRAMDVWYSKRFAPDGTVYKRFVSCTTEQLLASIAINKHKVDTEDAMNRVYLRAERGTAETKECTIMFLNHTQARYMFGFTNDYNTAIYIKK
jgi:hypothetical protein